MAQKKSTSTAEVDALLDELLADAYGDDEQLTALEQGIRDALESPVEVYVLGELMSLERVSYEGNPRRGVVAQCRRDDGREHRISLLDIGVGAQSEIYLHLAAYCQWCGVKPTRVESTSASGDNVRNPKAREEDIDLSKPVELIVLLVKERAARCRLPMSQRIITLKARDAWQCVPGQLVTVDPNKHWTHSGHPYLSGQIQSSRIDAAVLQLQPLELYECGTLDPEKLVGFEGGGMTGTRVKADDSVRTWTVFEMQQIVPGRTFDDLDDADSDPIIRASEWHEAGEFEEAQTLLAGLLEADLRCLDAHAHLGNMCFDREVERALNHFEAGVRIGELSLDENFDGLLPWFRLDNRPFLRCLNGYGLCLWRCQRWEETQQVFEQLLALDPLDTFEIQASLPMIAAHEQWPDVW